MSYHRREFSVGGQWLYHCLFLLMLFVYKYQIVEKIGNNIAVVQKSD